MITSPPSRGPIQIGPYKFDRVCYDADRDVAFMFSLGRGSGTAAGDDPDTQVFLWPIDDPESAEPVALELYDVCARAEGGFVEVTMPRAGVEYVSVDDLIGFDRDSLK